MLMIKRTSTGEPEPQGESQLAFMSMKYDKFSEASLWQVPLVRLKNSEEKNTAEGTMMVLGLASKILRLEPRFELFYNDFGVLRNSFLDFFKQPLPVIITLFENWSPIAISKFLLFKNMVYFYRFFILRIFVYYTVYC